MLDTVQTVAQNLSQTDVLLSAAIRLVGGIMVGVVVAVLLICAGFILAQCCGGDRRKGLPAFLLLLVACLSSGIGTVSAQEARTQDSVPEVEPRLEQLFWSDSLRLWDVGLSGRPDGVSLSPDGRWIVLSAFREADRVNLWMASVSTGESIPLTSGRYLDQGPVWYPDGRAVAFSSSRPTEPRATTLSPMRISLSQEDGSPLGPPRQIALEGGTEFAISPDGKSMAYASGGDGGGESLKVIPAAGGNARTVITMRTILMPRWGPEDRFLYFLGQADSESPWAVMRVPVEGGMEERLSTWDPPPWIRLSPRGQYLYREVPSQATHSTVYELATAKGEPLARFNLPEEYVLMGFAGGPTQLLAARQDMVNPLRILPVFGGPTRQLNDQWGYDIPLAWSPDSEEVLFQTELNGEDIFMFAPSDGGTMRQIPLPGSADQSSWPLLSADGKNVFYLAEGADEDHRTLWSYDIEDGSTRMLDDGLHPYERTPGFGHKGAGVGSNPFRSDQGVGYWVTRNGYHDILVADPSGGTRLLWRLPARDNGPPRFAIHGDRIAFTECDRQRESCSLFLAESGQTEPKFLFSIPASLSYLNRPVWSPDGHLLAIEHSLPSGDGLDVLLVEVNPSGDLVGEPRLLPMDGGPRFWWSLQWVPGDEYFLVSGMGSEAIMDTEVWLISTDPDEPPKPLTSSLHESVWNFSLSPDGKHFAIESDMPRGVSIWRIDLGDVLPGRER